MVEDESKGGAPPQNEEDYLEDGIQESNGPPPKYGKEDEYPDQNDYPEPDDYPEENKGPDGIEGNAGPNENDELDDPEPEIPVNQEVDGNIFFLSLISTFT